MDPLEARLDNEQIQLTRIIPEEIWLMITDLLEPDDKTRISNSSPYFRKILASQKTLFLFPKVWNILGMKYEAANYYWNKSYVDSIIGRRSYSSTVCSIRRWYGNITRMRLVCKTWCQAIDLFYANFEDIYRMDLDAEKRQVKKYFDRPPVHPNAQWTRQYYFYNSYLEDKFLKHFESTHSKTERSPFLANSVEMRLNGMRFQHLLIYDFALEALKEYGKHVWHLKLIFQEDFEFYNETNSELVETLVKNLALCPNLKTLDITQEESIPFRGNLDVYEHAIRQLPFPHWKDLVYLKTNCLLAPFFNGILRRNQHISMLQVKRTDYESEGYVIFEDMPNLKQLSLEICTKEDFRQLENLKVNWKLEKLCLDFSQCDYFEYAKIFQYLQNNWASTLKNVAIHLPKAENPAEEIRLMRECGTLKLNLPHVTRCKLVLENFVPLDFLLPMRNLIEYLEVYVEAVEYENWKQKPFASVIVKNQRIQFLGFLDNLDNSTNIWGVFPKLKVFHLKKEKKLQRYNIFRKN